MEAHVSVSSLAVGAVLRAVVAKGCGAHLGGEVRWVRGAVVQMRRANLEIGPDAVHDEGQDPLVRDELEERGVGRQAVAHLEAAPGVHAPPHDKNPSRVRTRPASALSHVPVHARPALAVHPPRVCLS